MPETMSLERRTVLLALGAKLEITPAAGRIGASIERAKQLLTEIPDSVMLDQFGNPSNPAVHFRTTGPELWRDTDGKIDVLISGVGTGGTLTGTGGYLKTQNPNIKIIAVEPEGADDAYRSWKAGEIIPMVGPKTVADGLLTSLGDKTFPIIQRLVDEIVTVSDEAILKAMKLIWERAKLVVEPSGVVPLGALLEGKVDLSGKKVGIILSGGNVDFGRFGG
jgi:threonine dehydratase